VALCAEASGQAVVTGELRKWHKVTLTFTGPNTSETATPNPFRNYRLNVTFTAPSGAKIVVPGYYAADGNAGQTGATTGSKWRAHLLPNATGTWTYVASFRTGTDIAASLVATDGTATSFNGTTGSFSIAATNKVAPDLRAKGLLRYVGKHQLQFAETGEYFLKGGADSPENLLGYADFDGTYDTGGLRTTDANFLHKYAAHVIDWRTGDPTWRSGKGKGIIGALNYLGSEGVNSIYFLTYNIDGGDGRDTWMWTSPSVRDRYDVSKLDQWGIVFDHAARKGIQLHVVTQERENDTVFTGGNMTAPRKIYYRELIARFAHHPAVQWNLGEENENTYDQRVAMAKFIRLTDPYDHPTTVHTHAQKPLDTYSSLFGNPYFESTSIQGYATSFNTWAKQIRSYSASAGRKWAVYGDEPMAEVKMDMSNVPSLIRDGLWGNLMGGGAGVEWYFGYQAANFGDLTTEDFSMAEPLWQRTAVTLDFFQQYLPFWDMVPSDSLASGGSTVRVLAKPGSTYAVYLPNGGTTNLTVPSGQYQVAWYDPISGGPLEWGSVTQLTGPGTFGIGNSPCNDRVEYTVTVPASGTWYAWGRFYYPGTPGSNDANSFQLQIDNNAPLRFGNNKDYFQKWHWGGDGAVESGALTPLKLGYLTAGKHTLRVLKREVSPIAPRLDAMVLSRTTTVPTDADALKGLTTGTGDGRVWIGASTDPSGVFYGDMTYCNEYTNGADLDTAKNSLLGALVHVDNAADAAMASDTSAVALITRQ
jgi:hypothetical protein